MRILVSITMAGLLALPLGCKSKDEGDSGEAPATGEKPTEGEDTADDTPAAATDAGAATAAEAAEADLPTAEDFEEEVKQDVTKENLEKELKEIEDQLGE